MQDERNTEQQLSPAPPPPTSDTTRWAAGYFPYDTSAKSKAAAPPPGASLPGDPIRPASPAPSAPPRPVTSAPPKRNTYGNTFPPAGEGRRTPPGMQQYPPVEPRRREPPTETPKADDIDIDSAPKGRGGKIARVICLLLACAIIGGGTGFFVSQRVLTDWEANQAAQEVLSPLPTPTPIATPAPTPPPATPDHSGTLTAAEIYELGRQQVVGITTEVTTTNIFGQASTGRVSGSGFIISSDGYILTNYHVIQGATRILVMLGDYSMHEATLVGGEGVTSDMAVLKIDTSELDLPAARLGNSAEMRVGSPVFAIGNPLGELTFSITSGIVSALNREVAVEQGQTLNMFQIDAAVNSGNSGGPVYNELGEVVGVVTAKSSLDGVEGIGFAIPINDAIHYANQLIERGYIARPHLGIFPVTVSESYAHYFRTVMGVFVNTVYPDSAAERGGILVGDIITSMGGRDIRTVEDLRSALGGFAAGDTVVITVFRDGAHLDLTVVLGDRPADE